MINNCALTEREECRGFIASGILSVLFTIVYPASGASVSDAFYRNSVSSRFFPVFCGRVGGVEKADRLAVFRGFHLF